MARREQFMQSISERYHRNFSDNFKIAKVREIEQGKTKICDIRKEYEVTYSTIYRWLDKYGKMKKQGPKVIVGVESDTQQILQLKQKIAELERIIGQKQVLLDFKDKMIDIAERVNGIIKNNYLVHRQIKTYADLVKEVNRSVKLYNHNKPHIGLNRDTPINFEKKILYLQQQAKPKMKESFDANKQIFWGIEPQKTEQAKPQFQDVFSANKLEMSQ